MRTARKAVCTNLQFAGITSSFTSVSLDCRWTRRFESKEVLKLLEMSSEHILYHAYFVLIVVVGVKTLGEDSSGRAIELGMRFLPEIDLEIGNIAART